jgi:Tfp pilus assembly PilM family ATPase
MKLKGDIYRRQSEKIIVSLDIGSESIRVIKGLRQDKEVKVLDFASRKYSAQEASANLLSSSIYELLTSLIDVKKLKKARIHTIISGRKLCVRVVKLPLMPMDEIQQAIKSQIRKFVSPDLEQVIFSFSVLREIQEKGINKLEIVFVAIQKDSFDEYLQLFKLIGLKPKVITSACFCGWNLVHWANLDKDITSLMLVNIEAQDSDLTVYRDGRFVFTRNISIGAKDFIDLKVDLFCKEIELTANHYYQITHGKRIDKCIVLGEGSQIEGLLKTLNQKLEISLETLRISDLSQGLSIIDKRAEFAKDLSLYTQSLGALLISSDDINLLSSMEPRLRKDVSFLKFLALPKMTALAIIIFVSLALIIFIFLKGTSLFYQYQIRSFKMKQDKLQNRTLQLIRIRQKMDILNFEKQLYLRLIKRYPAYLVFINQICQAMPDKWIILNELEFHSEAKTDSSEHLSVVRFSMRGKILEKNMPESEITRFVLALEQSDYFENISVAMERVKKKELNFAIDGIARLQD